MVAMSDTLCYFLTILQIFVMPHVCIFIISLRDVVMQLLLLGALLSQVFAPILTGRPFLAKVLI